VLSDSGEESPAWLTCAVRHSWTPREHGGNATAGTRVHARHSFSVDPFGLRDFRGRDDPLLPLLPVSDLDGKEGVNGSSPLEGFKNTLQTGMFSRSLLPTRAPEGTPREH
jgi:hypothetical protein